MPQCAFRAPTEPTLYSNLVTSQTGASGYARRHNDEDDHEDHNNDGGDLGDDGDGGDDDPIHMIISHTILDTS